MQVTILQTQTSFASHAELVWLAESVWRLQGLSSLLRVLKPRTASECCRHKCRSGQAVNINNKCIRLDHKLSQVDTRTQFPVQAWL